MHGKYHFIFSLDADTFNLIKYHVFFFYFANLIEKNTNNLLNLVDFLTPIKRIYTKHVVIEIFQAKKIHDNPRMIASQ